MWLNIDNELWVKTMSCGYRKCVVGKENDWLIDYMFIVLHPIWKYFIHKETTPLSVKGSQNVSHGLELMA